MNEQCNSDTWIFPFLVHSPIRCTQAWSGRIGGHWWSRCHSTSTCQRSHGTISSVSVINCEWVRLREVFAWNYIIWQDFEIIKVTLCVFFFWCSKYWFDKITYSCMYRYEINCFKMCTSVHAERSIQIYFTFMHSFREIISLKTEDVFIVRYMYTGTHDVTTSSFSY